MNDLSWLIFMADVIPQLAMALSVAAFILFLPSIFVWFLGFVGFFGDEADGQEYAVALAPRFRSLWWLPTLCFVCWLLSFAVPDDKETYYAIAASEVGESIIKSPSVQQTTSKAFQALDSWLDSKITEDVKEIEKKKTEESDG